MPIQLLNLDENHVDLTVLLDRHNSEIDRHRLGRCSQREVPLGERFASQHRSLEIRFNSPVTQAENRPGPHSLNLAGTHSEKHLTGRIDVNQPITGIEDQNSIGQMIQNPRILIDREVRAHVDS